MQLRQLGHRGGDLGLLVLVHDRGDEDEQYPREPPGDDRQGLPPGPVPPPAALAALARPAVPAVAAVAPGPAHAGDALAAGEAGGAAILQGRGGARAAGPAIAGGI